MGFLYFDYLIYFMVFLQLIGLVFAVMVDPYISRAHRIAMMFNTLLVVVLIAQNYLEYHFSLIQSMYFERLIVSIVGYSIRPVIVVLWLYLIKKNQKLIIAWIIVGINVLIHMTALFTNVCFTITSDNSFVRGPLGYTCHVVSGILLLYLLWLSADKYIESGYSKIDKKNVIKTEFTRYRYGLEGLIPIWCIIMIVTSVVLDSKIYSEDAPIVFLTVAIVSCNLFYYIWLHLGFVREHEEELKANQRIQIMMSQIKPHFLYNTLSTIQALCLTDPEKAADTSEKFGVYLRRNLDSLNQAELIPFSKELEHTKVYVDIEQIRFPSIKLECDMTGLEDSDFNVPALTLQPIVENAIRHGVRSRKDGVIKVTARKVVEKIDGGVHNGDIYKMYLQGGDIHLQQKHYEIIIEDNGKGFDVSELAELDEEHIGLRNVRERIESQCGGKVRVESVIDKGTTVTIQIPF